VTNAIHATAGTMERADANTVEMFSVHVLSRDGGQLWDLELKSKGVIEIDQW